VAKLKKFDSLLILSWPKGPLKRLRKTDVNLTRTMAWFETTRIGLNAKSAYEVEGLLDPATFRMEAGSKMRPRRWGPYHKGTSIPDLRSKERNPVTLAEAEVPCSLRWFLSPLWCALDGKNLNYRDLETYLKADPVTVNALCKYEEFNGVKIPRIDVEHISNLRGLRGLELLESMVLLLEIGRLSNSPYLVATTLKAYVNRAAEIAEMPQLVEIYPRLFDHIEDRYLPTWHASHEDDFIPPWRVREPQLYEPIAQRLLDELRTEHPEYGL
jgi:hypothetical protein